MLITMTQPAADSRNLALDGLRTLAVLAVLVQHSFMTRAHLLTSPGSLGVRVFFVLSGFLITGILISARQQAEATGVAMGQVWRAFLLRRALRIFPLAYLALGLAWLLGTHAMREHGVWYWTYLGNILPAFFGRDLNDEMAHFWSLAIEEHFYLLWPVMMLWVPRRLWQSTAIATIVLAALLRIVHVELGGIWPAYLLTWCRMDALAFGGLLAMRSVPVRTLLLIASGLVVTGGLAGSQTAAQFSLMESAFVVASGALIVGVSQGWGQSFLRARPLVYIGSLSYGMYVWGLMMSTVLLPALERATGLDVLPAELGWMHFLVTTTGTILLSMLSWHLIERPLNDLKRYVPYVATRRARVTAAVIPAPAVS
jgi:peptidoglycan/LPS O-acetylase OafA/YrhL